MIRRTKNGYSITVTKAQANMYRTYCVSKRPRILKRARKWKATIGEGVSLNDWISARATITVRFIPIPDWIKADDMLPPEWGKQHGYLPAGRYRVRLVDGRELNTTWNDSGWFVEQVMPHLRVDRWRRPRITG
jgi:hypothetical protein